MKSLLQQWRVRLSFFWRGQEIDFESALSQTETLNRLERTFADSPLFVFSRDRRVPSQIRIRSKNERDPGAVVLHASVESAGERSRVSLRFINRSGFIVASVCAAFLFVAPLLLLLGVVELVNALPQVSLEHFLFLALAIFIPFVAHASLMSFHQLAMKNIDHLMLTIEKAFRTEST